MDIKEILKTAAGVLVVIWVANQIEPTRSLVQRALTGQ
jgi:hypothetical protein